MCIGKNAAGYREERSRRRQQGMPASSPHAARQHKRCTLQRKLLISLAVAGFYSAVSQYAIISKSNNYLQDSKYIDSFKRFPKWIANSHMWLRSSLWVPRDQNQMDKLCNVPGCPSGGQFHNAKKLDDKKSTAIRTAYQNESKVEGDRRALVKMLGMGGRLGDQMFMYASTLAFANKYNLIPCIETYLEPRKDMANMFVGPFEFCENRDHDINWNWEGHCEDEPSKRMPPFSMEGGEGKSVGLWGYMHFAEYFLEIKAKVFETYALVPELQIKAEERLKTYGDAMLVGVHVRRGDRSSIAGRWDVTYYERALDYMRKKYTKNGKRIVFIVASDGKDWVKKQDVFQNPDVQVLEGTSYQEDLATLINCNHAILSGGGFGFWFAFLGPWQHEGEVLMNKHQEPCSRLEEWTFIEDVA